MKPLLCISSFVLLVVLTNSVACAQDFAREKDFAVASRILDSAPAKSPLPCAFDLSGGRFLDFLYRYPVGFQIGCKLGNKILPGTTWIAAIRVTNQDGKRVLMLEELDIPQVPRESQTRFDAPLSKLNVLMGGGFAAGPGRYLVEIALTDRQGDSIRKSWRLKLPEYKGAPKIPSAMPPGAVAPMHPPRWDGALNGAGIRVTVMLDIESIYPFPWLGAWGREYLLQSLASLLEQLPSKSVRLIAFNLERQQVLFSQDSLDSKGFTKLEKTLGQVRFDTIPYQSLRQGAGVNFLVNLTEQEIAPMDADGAVVFLGIAGMRPENKLRGEMLNKLETRSTHVYYLSYFNLGDPDSIGDLTKKLHGAIFSFNSPESLAHAIAKISNQMGAAPLTPDAQTPGPEPKIANPPNPE
jgi:hypothetical protein